MAKILTAHPPPPPPPHPHPLLGGTSKSNRTKRILTGISSKKLTRRHLIKRAKRKKKRKSMNCFPSTKLKCNSVYFLATLNVLCKLIMFLYIRRLGHYYRYDKQVKLHDWEHRINMSLNGPLVKLRNNVTCILLDF